MPTFSAKNKNLKSDKDIQTLKKKNITYTVTYYGSIFMAVLAGILLVLPTLPQLEFFVDKAFNPQKYQDSYYSVDNQQPKQVTINFQQPQVEEAVERYNNVVIPTIGLDVQMFEGGVERLEIGAWLKPNGSSPDKSGNTIITGHRYQYFYGIRPFYHLDKVNKGDTVLIYWHGEEKKYQVSEKFIVADTEMWVEDQTDQTMITIYTCEGLISDQRLVVRAVPA